MMLGATGERCIQRGRPTRRSHSQRCLWWKETKSDRGTKKWLWSNSRQKRCQGCLVVLWFVQFKPAGVETVESVGLLPKVRKQAGCGWTRKYEEKQISTHRLWGQMGEMWEKGKRWQEINVSQPEPNPRCCSFLDQQEAPSVWFLALCATPGFTQPLTLRSP